MTNTNSNTDETNTLEKLHDVQEKREILSATIAGASTLLDDIEPEKSLGLRTSYWDFIHSLEELKINGGICLLAAEGLDSGVWSTASAIGLCSARTTRTPFSSLLRTGVTRFLEAGGTMEEAANHADMRTTRVYDKRDRVIRRTPVERIVY